MKARLESLVAVCALLVATIAAAAAAYQTYVINEQFSATVWPYLSFDSSNDASGSSFEFGLRNVGLGPAIVRSTIVSVNGQPMGPGTTGNAIHTAVEPALESARAAERRRHQHGLVHATTSSLGPGDVVPAGSSMLLLRVAGPDIYPKVMAMSPHVDISICYCSVLGRCWTRRLKDPVPEPRDVRYCPLPK
ncbi:MAG TPA: hypothetical protein VGG89_09330 [Candidatus Baltobacteraceae bacterium]